MDKQIAVPEAVIKETKDLTEVASSLEIKSSEDAEKATVLLSQIKKAFKNAEDVRLTFTKPINESLNAINKKFKEATQPLIQSETVIKNKILTWRREENEKLRKEEERRRKIQEAHAEKGHEVKAPVQMERVEKTVGKSQVRTVKAYELVDFGLLGNEYKTVDEVAIRKAIQSGVTEIPGLRIYDKEILAVRG